MFAALALALLVAAPAGGGTLDITGNNDFSASDIEDGVGAGDLTKAGSGTLYLGVGADGDGNGYTGNTHINGGVVKIDDDMIMFAWRGVRRDANQLSRHAEMKQPDCAAGQVQENIFCQAADPFDPLAGQGGECALIHGHAQTRLENLDAPDRPA